jgi:trimethylamine--corrinoid protein Co-methyltransferase
LAVDLIEKVGPGGDFLAQEHTVMHMMDEYFETSLADRTHYEDWVSSGRQDMKMRARVKLDELMKSHNPCYIKDAENREIRSRFPEIRD